MLRKCIYEQKDSQSIPPQSFWDAGSWKLTICRNLGNMTSLGGNPYSHWGSPGKWPSSLLSPMGTGIQLVLN